MVLKFSVVIPTYNRAGFLPATISSVIKQEYKNFEIIVVDDGSTDQTAEVISRIRESNPGVELHYFAKQNQERGAARNYGAQRAVGEYICFLDSDDELYSHHLSAAKKFIELHPDVEIFHLGYDIKNGKGKVIGRGPFFEEPPNQRLIEGNCLSCNGVFLRKDIALENPFSEDRNLSVFEDWELWLRLASNYTINYSNEITSSIFNHVDRSVLEPNKEKLILRMNVMLKSVLLNSDIVVYYLPKLRKFKTSCYSYVSLHLSLNRQYRREALKYLMKTLGNNPFFIFHKRFVVILKHLWIP